MTRTIQSVSLISQYDSGKDLTVDKHKANREKKSDHIALLIKVSIISIACVFLAFISISIFGIHSMKTTSHKLADTIGVEKIDNDTENLINANIVKYIIKMTVVTFIILLAFVAFWVLGYKYNFLSRKVKWR
jgi:magnesium-transporting ATPase (P-type)